MQFETPRCVILRRTNVQNREYKYSRDEAISNAMGPIIKSLPH